MLTEMTAKLTHKQKVGYGVTALVIVLYFFPNIAHLVRSPFASPPARKPSAAIPYPPPVPPPTQAEIAARAATAQAAADAGLFSGKWAAQQLLKDRGNCQLVLEIRPQPVVERQFAGYSSLTCVNLELDQHGRINPLFAANMMKQKLAPASAILTGPVTNGAIEYKMTKIVAKDEGDCEMRTMNATPFGTRQLAVEWQDRCGAGEMTLGKVAN